jgi:hypothetical protein
MQKNFSPTNLIESGGLKVGSKIFFQRPPPKNEPTSPKTLPFCCELVVDFLILQQPSTVR